jgi:hypothetical protein
MGLFWNQDLCNCTRKLAGPKDWKVITPEKFRVLYVYTYHIHTEEQGQTTTSKDSSRLLLWHRGSQGGMCIKMTWSVLKTQLHTVPQSFPCSRSRKSYIFISHKFLGDVRLWSSKHTLGTTVIEYRGPAWCSNYSKTVIHNLYEISNSLNK